MSTSPTVNAATSDIINTEQDLINEIKSLQAYETTLFQNLEAKISANTATPSELQDLSNQINEVSNTRADLYKILYEMNSFYVNNLGDTSISLQNQTVALEIVENELNEAKIRLSYIEQQKINKLRLVEIKKYYGEKYEERTYIMSYIVGLFVWTFILSLLSNRGLLPDNVYFLLLLIVFVFYGIMIVRTLMRIVYRDKMNYEEYDYGNAGILPTANPNLNYTPYTINGRWQTCTGQACCAPNETYDPVQNVCIPNPGSCAATTTTTAAGVGTTTTPPFNSPYSADYFASGQADATSFASGGLTSYLA